MHEGVLPVDGDDAVGAVVVVDAVVYAVDAGDDLMVL